MKNALEERLQNWGRWSRENRATGRTSASPLYGLMVAAGTVRIGAMRRLSVDSEDARRVEKAIAAADLYDFQRSIIKQRYVSCWSATQICTANRLRFKFFDSYLREAKEQIEKKLTSQTSEM